MELPKEQYEYQKTLADIGEKISACRAILSQWEETKEEYMTQRESEAQDRINALVQESREALTLVSTNQEELTALSHQVSDLSDFLSKTVDIIGANVNEYSTFVDTFRKDCEEMSKKIAHEIVDAKIMRDVITKEKEQNLLERSRLEEMQRHIDSQTHTLTLAFAELRAKQSQL